MSEKAGRKPKRYYVTPDAMGVRQSWYVRDRTRNQTMDNIVCRAYNEGDAKHIAACLNAAEVA